MATQTFKGIDTLSPADRQLFNLFGTGESVKVPFSCVHHAFEHFAHKHPYNIAVEDVNGQKIAFTELDRQANCLATHLRQKGVRPGSRVCLLVERSIWMVVGILGILKAGGAYVPLDGNVVSDKTLEHALKDSGSSMALTLSKFKHRITSGLEIMALEETVCESPYSTHCGKPEDLSTTNDSAYIIYTSGTTGVPKGVDVMHKNVCNLVCVSPGNLKMAPGVRVSQLMNISFDMAAWEILGSMANGATLCLRGKTSKEWRAVMKTVDVVVATPSMLAPHDPKENPTIKVVAVAGEPCPKALADTWAKTVDFYNCCGPTEITIVNTMHHHYPGIDLGIGGPTPNNTVYVLDPETGTPCKVGEMGVMWAGGDGITRGYLNLPDKTAEKYRLDPFKDDGSMMFNTGDLGRWYQNGDLEHLGRVDHQVKVKGFRVELDGVAAAMETTAGVEVATAILIKGELWGFFAPIVASVDAVKEATAKILPYYAVPTKYIRVSEFPKTTNGKSDKRALEKLAADHGEGDIPSSGAVAAAPTPVALPPGPPLVTIEPPPPRPKVKAPSEPISFVPNPAFKKGPRLPKTAFNQSQLQHLSAVDKQLFTQFGLGEREKPAFDLVHRAFEHYAALHPENIAVEDFGHKITFEELDRQANCLATTLRSKGVNPGSRVCLLVERSIYMVVGIIATLKAGGAYVPLDGNVVSDKTLQHALKDSGSSLVLVQRKFVHRVGTHPILCVEDVIHSAHVADHCVKPEDTSKTTDSAYIIYTSGTTGVPKGVDVMHKNVTNLVCMSPGNLKMGPGVRVSQLMNISFDMAAWEILGSMSNGATLVLRGKTSKEWRAVMKTVDVVVATPSMLAPHDPAENPTIKVVAVAGEPCPKALADKWAKTTSFYNCCGPTEITIVNTMHLHKAGGSLGIGGPTPNNTVYVLDPETMAPVGVGEMGVMWAGGDGITRGYLNLPDKTNEKYLRDPFLDDGSIMFNTGDLGRWMSNGDLEHMGRIDHQVKVKGFRVELDGVAAAMESTPGVKVATAILIDQELWGFYAPKTAAVEDVKATTAKVLPYYAVPTQYIVLDTFPETANGKSDKRALEKLARDQLAGGPAPSSAKVEVAPAKAVEAPAPAPPAPTTTPFKPVKPTPAPVEPAPAPAPTPKPAPAPAKAVPSYIPIAPVPPPPGQTYTPTPTASGSNPFASLIQPPSLYSQIAVNPAPIMVHTVTVPEPPAIQAAAPANPFMQQVNASTTSVATTATAMTSRSEAPTLIGIPPVEKIEKKPEAPKTEAPREVAAPVEKNIDASKLEGQTSIWAGYKEDALPPKTHSRAVRNFRYQLWYLYRRLFSIVYVINLAIFIWYAVKGANAAEIAKPVIGNLFLAILMRQEYVIDTFFVTCTIIPPSWPMAIRSVAARVYHIGGLHSGGGVSGTTWLILFCARGTQEVIRGNGVSGATLVFSYAILIILCFILFFVFPANRKKFHDTFEATHRFLGWSATALVWGQVVLLTNDYRGTTSLHKALLHSAPLWLTVVITISLVLPWLRLRHVDVRCEKLSNHCVRMYFDYTTPGAGSFVRLSDAPWTEWHSFATIPEPGKQGFSLVVSRAGDWSSRMIAKPPTKIWTRGIPTYGVMRIARLFNRIVVVATGSGIGPCTPAILARAQPIRLLWTAPNVRETFGDKLVGQILEANPEAVIYNTREHGKPDMVKLSWRLVKEFNAEALIIISNQPLTEKVVYGMVSRGLPAFGAIWDS